MMRLLRLLLRLLLQGYEWLVPPPEQECSHGLGVMLCEMCGQPLSSHSEAEFAEGQGHGGREPFGYLKPGALRQGGMLWDTWDSPR